MSLVKRWVLAFVAPKPLVGALQLPRYFRDWRRFRRAAPGTARIADSYPCLLDWSPSTPFDPHYFYQGAWLARELESAGTTLHVDVGSSVMMVSVLSARVPTVFVDYRPLVASLPGLLSVAGDIGRLPFGDASLASVSALHVLEHIGLGRYGDPLDPEGSARAARELARVVAPGGRLYISVPTGRERICFNAHRVFDPDTVLRMFEPLRPAAFALVDDAGRFVPQARHGDAAGLEYGCGMYVFTRT